jgi:hypothetical protein
MMIIWLFTIQNSVIICYNYYLGFSGILWDFVVVYPQEWGT